MYACKKTRPDRWRKLKVFFSMSKSGIQAMNASNDKLPVNGNESTINKPESELSKNRHFLDK